MATVTSPAKCSLLPPVGERVVVVLPPAAICQRLDLLRRKYDPEWFQRVPPHVSLAGPIRPGSPDLKTTALVKDAVAGMAPFEVKLSRPGAFVVPELILFLSIEDERPFLALHERLRRTLSFVPRFAYVPHVTLGHFASQADLEPAYREAVALVAAGELAFDVREVHLFGEDPVENPGVYRSVSRIELDSGAGR